MYSIFFGNGLPGLKDLGRHGPVGQGLLVAQFAVVSNGKAVHLVAYFHKQVEGRVPDGQLNAFCRAGQINAFVRFGQGNKRDRYARPFKRVLRSVDLAFPAVQQNQVRRLGRIPFDLAQAPENVFFQNRCRPFPAGGSVF